MHSKVQVTNPPEITQEDSFRESPLEQVRRLFVGFIQGLFAAAPRGMYHWEPNTETTEIFISDENPIKIDAIGVRPAISVTRGPVQFHSLGFDDLLSYDFRTGEKVKGVLVPGTAFINCVCRVDLEAERIAWIVGEQLWLNREMLMRAGFFEIGRKPSFGAPSPAGSLVAGDNADEAYVVTVSCPFQFYRTSKVVPLGAPILRHIEATLRARVVSPHPSCGSASTAGADLPVSITSSLPASFVPDASDASGNTPNPGFSAPQLPVVPHPLNPAQQVTVRAHRPNCAAIKAPSIRGRTIPISTMHVEESCDKQVISNVTTLAKIKL